MDITDVHDLNRCFPAGRWARCVCRFGRRKVNRILCDSRKIKEAKDCGAKENGGSRGYIHIAKIMRQYRAFASDGTLANVRVFCLLVINIGSFSQKGLLIPARIQTWVITSTKSSLPKWARVCRTTNNDCTGQRRAHKLSLSYLPHRQRRS
jgi:hypothetical protein